MSNNPISSPNEVSTKSTFEDWRQITNQIIKRLNSLYSESGANGTPDDNLSVYNDTYLRGNLTVIGTTTTVNSTTVTVVDPIVVVP